ncbi:MAG: glucose-1-phosphate cytidylyltransferase [Actinomycetota bacterium]|nr:glucose-1-phosphate cytidylyltransferase [Actinomycetota bacterium]
MKAVILAGGLGSRLSEETVLRPKPMVDIGGKPTLWHIMKIYAAHGIQEFVVCLGYKGYLIKEWFANYALHTSHVTLNLDDGSMDVHHSTTEPWTVTLVDTGEDTQTGSRLKRVLPYVGDKDFCFTYGDGLADIDVGALVAFHREQRVLATVTAVQLAGRFGALDFDEDTLRVLAFREKPRGDGAWINGGFFVLSPQIGRYIESDPSVWEQEPLNRLAADAQLAAFRHSGFWMAMDTLRDRNVMQELWDSGRAPWTAWS